MTGKKLIDTILTAVSLLTTLAVIGLFYWTEKIYKKPPIDEEKEKKELLASTSQKEIPTLFKVDKMILSLSNNSEKNNQRLHWIEVETNLALFNEEMLPTLKEKLPLIQDRIIAVCSKMGKEELSTLSGKVLLEERLKNEINKVLNDKVVKNIFFSKFVIQ